MKDKTILDICNLPAHNGAWKEPTRGYEPGPNLFKVWSATTSCVFSVYGRSQEIADKNWNEFMEMTRHE